MLILFKKKYLDIFSKSISCAVGKKLIIIFLQNYAANNSWIELMIIVQKMKPDTKNETQLSLYPISNGISYFQTIA